ncbi:MAG TPA: response regulator [Verrucomicrobiae bacterium]|nr:response regulator [Verrucomicrobiae bacterium]
MKQRILFVDDEPMILQALRRQLHSLRREWDLEFATSGEQALRVMAERPCKVLVSDMQMPGMDGAELMLEVMKRYPDTVRLILSGGADQGVMVKNVGPVHQHLCKPCDPEELRAVIQRVVTFDLSIPDSTVRRLVTRMDRLPSLPKLYGDLVAALEKPDVGFDEVAAIISRDIGMMTLILRLANSAFFGIGQSVSNPAEAISRLGLETVKSLVLSMGVFSQLDTKPLPGWSVETFWDHCLLTAAAAKVVARAIGADRKVVDESFVAGMLHDAGRLIFVANLRDAYEKVLQLAHDEKIPLLEAEQRILGSTHAEVGGYLLALWGLPVPVVEAIAFHHHPSRSALKTSGALLTCHVANVLVQGRTVIHEGVPGPSLDMAYLESLGLAGGVEEWQQAVDEIVLGEPTLCTEESSV